MIVAAIIVTYYPNEILLERLLCCICNEVDNIYIIDNTPIGTMHWLSSEWFIGTGFDVEYQSLGDNYGIAKAQNIGINSAINNCCDHVILFDQDSVPTIGIVQQLINAELKLIAANIKIGSVGPLILDKKTNLYGRAIRAVGLTVHKIKISKDEIWPVATDYTIASGSLIRVFILQEIGLMREELFIDWVDIEWGLRAGCFGCKNFIVPDAVMLHSIGDKFVFVGRMMINLHSDLRSYYIVRNACHLLLNKSINWRWRSNILFKIPMYIIFYSLTSTSKKRVRAFFLLLRACLDGFSGRLGKAF